MSFGKMMLPEFDDEMARTLKVLQAIPANTMDWKPAESLRSIGWNANHLADIAGWTPSILAEDSLDLAPPDGPAYETSSLSDLAELLELFDQGVKATRTALESVSDETLAEPWSLKMGGQILFTIPKGACLRTWVMNHTIHHRGILSVYLRMQGVELTPVYDG